MALMESMTYAFTHMRNFLLLLQAIGIWAFGLGTRPWGWGFDLWAGIWASKLGFELQVWDFGLDTEIWASMLEFESGEGGDGEEEGGE